MDTGRQEDAEEEERQEHSGARATFGSTPPLRRDQPDPPPPHSPSPWNSRDASRGRPRPLLAIFMPPLSSLA